jgi:ureidoglycolate dehydrogenase (NAD+)
MTASTLHVMPAALTILARDALCALGFGHDDADLIARVLVWADQRGHESHGVARIMRYGDFIRRGDMDPTARPHMRMDLGALKHMDGGRAAGPVAMNEAVVAALDGARAHGASWVLIGQTTHTGPIGYFVDQIARHGMIGLAFAAGTPLMAYHGTAKPTVSTSPLALSVPMAGDDPFVLDMATSIVAHGKIHHAARTGQPIPTGWALDDQGAPTTDPHQAKVMLPLGGPKGSGLALAFEMICSLGTGVPVLHNALTRPSPHIQNAAICAIDIGRLQPLESYKHSVADLVALIKAQPRAWGVDELLVPGERANRTAAERALSGIPIGAKTHTQLRELAYGA